METKRYFGRAVVVLALAACAAVGQPAPEWTVSYGQSPVASTARGNFYNNINFTSLFAFGDHATINFDWGLGAPIAGMFSDQVSVRWNGKVSPPMSQYYTFYALTDDGCRVWVDDQLVIDAWFDQGPTEHASGPISLRAGSVYNIRVDYYENTGGAVIRLDWGTSFDLSVPKQRVTFQDVPDGSESNFGAVLARLGDGKFAVSAPKAEVLLNVQQNSYIRDGGFAWYYDALGQPAGFASAPRNNLRHQYGSSMAGFGDGRVLVGAQDSATSGRDDLFAGGQCVFARCDGGAIAFVAKSRRSDGVRDDVWLGVGRVAGEPVCREFAGGFRGGLRSSMPARWARHWSRSRIRRRRVSNCLDIPWRHWGRTDF